MRILKTAFTLALLSSFACGDDGAEEAADAGITTDASVVDAVPVDADTTPDANLYPPLLRDTGLYSDFDNKIIASDVREYEVAYPLWSDGAIKRRWVYLPPSTTIDTTDMDFWVYPEGTKLWKEFKVDDLLVETRLLWKSGPSSSDWIYLSYAWNMAQDEATELPDGAVNVLGTTFDIPGQRDCRKCHQRQPDFALGFSAVQLAHGQAGVNLETLVTDSRLTTNPVGTAPYYPVPGAGDEQAAIGYLHGNCGGCHHKNSDVMDTTNLNLRLEVATLGSVAETVTYTTIVDVVPLISLTGATALIKPQNPSASAIYLRMEVRDSTAQMPPRGTELVDDDALAVLRAWINSLPL